MAREKLTAVKVRSLGPGKYDDGDGLRLHVVTTARRAWLFRYQRNGKRREMGLGALPAVSLADARDKAEATGKLLAADIDPINQREAQRQAEAAKQAHAVTFAQATKAYIAAHEAGWRNAKTAPNPWNGEPSPFGVQAASVTPMTAATIRKLETRPEVRRFIGPSRFCCLHALLASLVARAPSPHETTRMCVIGRRR